MSSPQRYPLISLRLRAQAGLRTALPGPVCRRGQNGMTLIEMMSAMAILILLMFVVIQLINNARNVTTASDKILDAESQARIVFDRMALDFNRMVKRADVDYVFNHSSGNDQLFFYSEAPALFTGSAAQQNPVSLVGYRINTEHRLERLGFGLSWDGASQGGVVFLSYPSYPVTGTSTPIAASTITGAFAPVVVSTSTVTSYHILAENVFRLECCFLLKPSRKTDGSYLPAVYSNSPWDTRIGHAGLVGIGLSDVQAIVVAIAVLDTTSRKILTSADDLQQMADALPDPRDQDLGANPPKLMSTTWQNRINDGTLRSLPVPKAAANQIRVYQRTFQLNP
ncbi:MAG: type II secretion system protein J [Chthoniobacteraceae bacterium]